MTIEMKIYFAGSIRGGRKDVKLYKDIIEYLFEFGEVLTEHVGKKEYTAWGEDQDPDEYIYKRDLNWLKSSDIVVAEVTTPSLGVGFEVATAISLKKPVLCLYRPKKGKRVSAMIKGCPEVTTEEYTNIQEAQESIKKFLSK
jgi:nucleoside 2-deoxyribosyltransferase